MGIQVLFYRRNIPVARIGIFLKCAVVQHFHCSLKMEIDPTCVFQVQKLLYSQSNLVLFLLFFVSVMLMGII